MKKLTIKKIICFLFSICKLLTLLICALCEFEIGKKILFIVFSFLFFSFQKMKKRTKFGIAFSGNLQMVYSFWCEDFFERILRTFLKTKKQKLIVRENFF